MSTKSALSVEHLSFAYDADLVLDDVTFSIAQGDVLALIGPNGGGKTTLLKLILGFLPMQQGSIRICGESASAMREHIGYVPQYATLHLDFPTHVLSMVLMGGANSNWRGGIWDTSRKAKHKAMELLDQLGLSSVAHRPLAHLSGGQRQRALIARALMGHPEKSSSPFLLLLDEPTASIDPQGKYCFYDFLQNLNKDLTIIVVTHDVMLISPHVCSVAVVNTTLDLIPSSELTPDTLTHLFGNHSGHRCPINTLQHGAAIAPLTHLSCR